MLLKPKVLLSGLCALAAIAVATAATLAACGGSQDIYEATQGSVIQNATVVNTRDGTLIPGQDIVLDGGKILRMQTAGSVHASGSARTVDGTGKYLVPGFLDMHAHAMVHADEKISYFPLMLAHGITGFREMGAFVGQYPGMVARARQLNTDSAAGRVDAPEVLLVPSDIYQASTSATAAVQQVDQQKALGVDFIKVISANRDAMLAYLSEAHNQGLYVAGHLSPAVSATESSQLGWKTIEHLGSGLGILLDCSTDEASMRQSILAAAGSAAPAFPSDTASLQRALTTYSADKCHTLADTFVRNGTWQVPTLRRVHTLDATDDVQFLNDPNMVYVDSARTALWAQLLKAFALQPEAKKAALRQIYSLQQAVTLLLKRSGVKMMAGSDAGSASIWVVPGIALHQEFYELAAAGLTPLEVLQMATLNGAEFLQRESTMGTVEVGKNADLVLLEANPLLDVAHLDQIAGVFLRGKYFSPAALAALASDTASVYAGTSAKAFAIPAAERSHTD